VTDAEVVRIADHLRMQSAPQYNNDVVAQPVQLNGKGGVVMDFDSGEGSDDMFRDAVRVVIEARIIEEMEEQGIIGPADGSRPREVLISSLDELGGEAEI
jgi:S-DNA-T family DNA segregation ATPase FtsK/SpoIIIE